MRTWVWQVLTWMTSEMVFDPAAAHTQTLSPKGLQSTSAPALTPAEAEAIAQAVAQAVAGGAIPAAVAAAAAAGAAAAVAEAVAKDVAPLSPPEVDMSPAFPRTASTTLESEEMLPHTLVSGDTAARASTSWPVLVSIPCPAVHPDPEGPTGTMCSPPPQLPESGNDAATNAMEPAMVEASCSGADLTLGIMECRRASALEPSWVSGSEQSSHETVALPVPPQLCPDMSEMYSMAVDLAQELREFTGPELLPVAAAVLQMAAACESCFARLLDRLLHGGQGSIHIKVYCSDVMADAMQCAPAIAVKRS